MGRMCAVRSPVSEGQRPADTLAPGRWGVRCSLTGEVQVQLAGAQLEQGRTGQGQADRTGTTVAPDPAEGLPAPPSSLRELSRQVQACAACGLSEERTKPVVGDGPADARLMVIGVVPRQHEDLQGVPFAGASRNVLDHALSSAGIPRDDVRTTTVVRCRPAGDRAPTHAEVEACATHLRAELRLVAPEVIVTLGAFATAVLLGRPVPIERVAGYRLDVLQGITLIPTYHPMDAVRGVPQAAPSLRRDLRVAKAVLDGRMKTGAQALAELRARQAAGS
jgi:uracil-DNA glycosylase